MPRLVFDIETIGEDFSKMDEITQHLITKRIKEPEGEDGYQSALDELEGGFALSPLTGEIVTIGMMDVDTGKGAIYYQAPGADIPDSEENGMKFKAMSEKEMLLRFWELAEGCDEFIGFNSRAFDVPYMIVRSAVNGIQPTRDLMSNRFVSLQRDGKHIDLLDQLTFYGAVFSNKGSLHMWCRAFGIKSPKADGVKGDEVSGLFREGKFLEIAKYNMGDVIATAELYDRWNKFIRF
ncbi:MAG: ribonuclease H-like domain-containing protein [Candidatus Colwellbacteria bacterium]|nr:ribonuclease H-like domain-containing protein [Candidatus Colwellbacteria bacterium]